MVSNLDEGSGSDSGERTYRTASGSYAEAYQGAVATALVMVVCVFAVMRMSWPWREDTPVGVVLLFSGWMLFLILAFLAPTLWSFMLARNSGVIVSDTGLTVVNWRNARHFIPWGSITGAIQWQVGPIGRSAGGGWLAVDVGYAAGHRRRIKIARHSGPRPPAMDALIDEIISRRGFSEVEKPQRNAVGRALGWFTRENARTWR